MNLAQRFLELIADRGSRPAIREPNGRTVSYAELHAQIVGFAIHLKSLGFKPGDAAVIQAPNGAAFTISSTAVGLLGGVSVLCEPGLGDDLYRERLRAARSNWVFVHPLVLWANRIPGARRLLRRREVLVPPLLPDSAAMRRIVISEKRLLSLAAAPGTPTPAVDVDAGADLSIIFTGGTTSAPKGVRLSHRGALAAMTNIATLARDALGQPMAAASATPGGARTMLADTPQQVLYGLTFGQEVIVTRGRMQRRAAMVRALIEEGRTSSYFGSPYLWMEMMEQAGSKRRRLPASLKAVFLGGAPVTAEFLAALQGWLSPDTKVTAIYGLTEAGPVAYATAEEKLAWRGEGDLAGHLMEGIEASVSSEGEIAIRSPSLFTGYVGQPPLAENAGFPTGDLGQIVSGDGGKLLVLFGRAKDMIIRAGVNVYPATFEADLRALTDDRGRRLLREAALVGLWDPGAQDEAVVLCWEPMADMAVDEAALLRRVEDVTGVAARPDFLMKTSPMPVTGRSNKVDKAALRVLAAQRFGLAPLPPGQRQ